MEKQTLWKKFKKAPQTLENPAYMKVLFYFTQ